MCLFVHLQKAEEGSVAYRWHQARPDENPEFSAKLFPARKVATLPKQNNYCDCGLFTLTYIHFFASFPPARLNFKELDAVGGQAPLPPIALITHIRYSLKVDILGSRLQIISSFESPLCEAAF